MPVQCSGGKKPPLPIAHWTKIQEFALKKGTSKIISYQSKITLLSLKPNAYNNKACPHLVPSTSPTLFVKTVWAPFWAQELENI